MNSRLSQMSERPFPCTSCCKAFNKKYNFKRHLELMHHVKMERVDRTVACLICDQVCPNKSSLDKHKKSHHPELFNKRISASTEQKYYVLDEMDVDQEKEDVDAVDSYILQDLLPKGYGYEILEFGNLEKGFICKVSFHIDDLEESNKFVEQFKSIHNTRYRLVASRRTQHILLEKRFCCHHQSRKHIPTKKNTNCPAELVLVIKRTLSNKLLCTATIHNKHNHETDIAEALKTLDPSPDVVKKYESMFESGMSPSMAAAKHEEDMKLLYGEDFDKIQANRRLCPSRQWAFSHYYKVLKKAYEKPTAKSSEIESFKNAIENLCTESNNPKCGRVVMNDDGTFTACISTLLMKKISSASQAGNICLFDSTGGLDKFGCRFTVSCLSSAEGLPIGIIVTTVKSEEAITDGLQLFSSLLEDDSFGGRGSQGPQVFQNDGSIAERKSLKKVFPQCTFLLRTFHVLRSIRRWLRDKNNNVSIQDQTVLFIMAKRILYAKNIGEMNAIIQGSYTIHLYPNFIQYFNTWLSRRNEWVLCLRPKHLREQNANNLLEANMRVLKEKCLDANGTFSPVLLVDFLLKDLPLYYRRKLNNTNIKKEITDACTTDDTDSECHGSLEDNSEEFSTKETTSMLPEAVDHVTISQRSTSPTLGTELSDADSSQHLFNDIKDIFSNICNRMEKDLPAFQDVMAILKRQYKKMYTDAALISALHSFAQFNSFVIRKRNANSSKIGGQSRKTSCDGRTTLHQKSLKKI